MTTARHSMFAFMLLVLFVFGVIGFSSFENIAMADAFHATVAALTFSSDTSDFSQQGKLLNSALALASVAVIVWAFVNFHRHSGQPEQGAADYFKLMPQDEGLVLQAVNASAKNGIAGKTKLNILENTGTVVIGVKKGKSFELNIDFNSRIANRATVLLMGTASQIKNALRSRK